MNLNALTLFIEQLWFKYLHELARIHGIFFWTPTWWCYYRSFWKYLNLNVLKIWNALVIFWFNEYYERIIYFIYFTIIRSSFYIIFYSSLFKFFIHFLNNNHICNFAEKLSHNYIICIARRILCKITFSAD